MVMWRFLLGNCLCVTSLPYYVFLFICMLFYRYDHTAKERRTRLWLVLALTMKVNVNVVAWIFFVNVLSVRISKQEKPEDCVPGKEFWSTFFNKQGTCAACPRYLDNCDDQGPDIEACQKSCGKSVDIIYIAVHVSILLMSLSSWKFVLFIHSSGNKIY